MNCKYCGEPLPAEQTGKRAREYCNNAHRQAHYRVRHDISQPTREARELATTQARIAELELEVANLRFDLERERYEVESRVGELNEVISAQAEAREQLAEAHSLTRERIEGMIKRREIATTLIPLGSRTQHQLTPEQQAQAVAYWDEHNVTYQRCPDCPHTPSVG